MNMIWVLLIYGAAAVLAVAWLYFFHVRTWYWHALSIVAALALGFAPPPSDPWRGQVYDLIVGFIFVLLMVWGIGGTLLFKTHHVRHASTGTLHRGSGSTR